MSGFTGLSFPFRVGSKGRVVLSTTTDVDLTHIKESITQILLTQKGERVNEPEFGSGLKQMVFENFDETVVYLQTRFEQINAKLGSLKFLLFLYKGL